MRKALGSIPSESNEGFVTPVTKADDGLVILAFAFNLKAMLPLLPRPVTALLPWLALAVWRPCYPCYPGR